MFKKFMLASALLALASTTSFAAVECFAVNNILDGRDIEIAFSRGTQGQAIVNIEGVIVAERCISGATSYHMVGLPKRYTSKMEIVRAIDAIELLRRLGFGPEDFKVALEFLKTTEDENKKKLSTSK